LIRKIGFLVVVSLLALALFGCGGKAPAGNATLTGSVLDAQSGNPVAGATVCLVWQGRPAVCVQSAADGAYTLEHLPAGEQVIRVTASGHITYEIHVVLVDGETTTRALSPSPNLSGGQWRIVLTWGENPNDLDSHTWVPNGGGYDEVYYSQKGHCDAAPYTCLDVDDTTSYGPETTTIMQMNSGTYHYAIHWFSGSGSWAASGATVQVYNSSGMVREFHAPADTTHTNKSWWYIFDLDNSGNIVVKNTVSDTPPFASSASVSSTAK